MHQINIEHALETAKILAFKAGEFSKERFGKVRINWKEVSASDLQGAKEYITRSVTPVDLASQKIILEGLIEQGYNKLTGVQAEEDIEELSQFADNPNLRWVIDPIDGTFNYGTANPETRSELESKIGIKIATDHRLYGISIGLQKDQADFLLGVVYLPRLNELFMAIKGKGATKNGKKVTAPQTRFSEDSMICLNTKSDFAKKAVRWSQNLCTVYSITGITDNKHSAFFAHNTHLHDVGPSTLILTEAGGFVSDEEGNPQYYSKADKKGKIPYYAAGPNRQFNLDMIKRIRDSGHNF